MRTGKLKKLLERSFGQKPDPYYFPGDMEHIRTYYDYRKKHELDEFLIDDITWNDLDMDRVFKRINMRLSASGEQYLYYMLRSPAVNAEDYRKRKRLIDYMGSHADVRLKLQLVLARLGCTRQSDIAAAFAPTTHKPYMLFLYAFLALLVPAAAVISLIP